MHTRHPRLIILGGFAGTGKSTVAQKLSQQFQLPWLSSDIIAKALQSSLAKTFHEVTPLAYDVLFEIARAHLKNDVSVIVDANMCHRKTWESLDALMAEFPAAQCVPFVLDGPLDTLRTRIDLRGQSDTEHNNLGGDLLEDILHKYEFMKNFQRPDIRRINTDRPVEEVYQEILEIVKSL